MIQENEQQYRDIIEEIGSLKDIHAPKEVHMRVKNVLLPSLSQKITPPAFILPAPALFALLLLVGLFGITGFAQAASQAKKGDLLYPVKEIMQHTPFAPFTSSTEHIATPSLSPSPSEATTSAQEKQKSEINIHSDANGEKSENENHDDSPVGHIQMVPEGEDHGKTEPTPTPESESNQKNNGVQGALEKVIHQIIPPPESESSVQGVSTRSSNGDTHAKNVLKGGD